MPARFSATKPCMFGLRLRRPNLDRKHVKFHPQPSTACGTSTHAATGQRQGNTFCLLMSPQSLATAHLRVWCQMIMSDTPRTGMACAQTQSSAEFWLASTFSRVGAAKPCLQELLSRSLAANKTVDGQTFAPLTNSARYRPLSRWVVHQ